MRKQSAFDVLVICSSKKRKSVLFVWLFVNLCF